MPKPFGTGHKILPGSSGLPLFNSQFRGFEAGLFQESLGDSDLFPFCLGGGREDAVSQEKL